jgi:hypothetical protein
MSFFLYNEDGRQSIARPFLDGAEPQPESDVDMPKYHLESKHDDDTNAPVRNFLYEFDVYRFVVSDGWEEVLHHSASGDVISGSLERLGEAFVAGREIKVGIRNLCGDLGGLSHEVFVQTGPAYYYSERKLLLAATQPVVRVRPQIPMRYETHAWDFGWLLPRTDGCLARWLIDPYTLAFHKTASRHAMRWFVR